MIRLLVCGREEAARCSAYNPHKKVDGWKALSRRSAATSVTFHGYESYSPYSISLGFKFLKIPQHCLYPVDDLRILLLEDLVSDSTREHMARDPGRSGWYGKREKHKGCD